MAEGAQQEAPERFSIDERPHNPASGPTRGEEAAARAAASPTPSPEPGGQQPAQPRPVLTPEQIAAAAAAPRSGAGPSSWAGSQRGETDLKPTPWQRAQSGDGLGRGGFGPRGY